MRESSPFFLEEDAVKSLGQGKAMEDPMNQKIGSRSMAESYWPNMVKNYKLTMSQ